MTILNKKLLLKIYANEQQLNQLTELNIEDKRLTKIDKKVFGRLIGANLEEISLRHNLFATIGLSQYAGALSMLTRLDLSQNCLGSLTRGQFSGLVNLKELNLNSNHIELMDSHAFDGLVSLSRIDLAGNCLEYVDFECLSQLSNLTSLKLSFNRIKKLIATDSFTVILDKILARNVQAQLRPLRKSRPFQHLVYLNLTLNEIHHLGCMTFRDFGNLTKLSLFGNAIERLNEDVFVNLSQLTNLDLRRNKMKQIDRNAFRGLDSLCELSLSGNELATLEPVFDSLVKLKILELHDNKLNFVDVSVFVPLRYNVKLVTLFSNNDQLLYSFADENYFCDNLVHKSIYEHYFRTTNSQDDTKRRYCFGQMQHFLDQFLNFSFLFE